LEVQIRCRGRARSIVKGRRKWPRAGKQSEQLVRKILIGGTRTGVGYEKHNKSKINGYVKGKVYKNDTGPKGGGGR